MAFRKALHLNFFAGAKSIHLFQIRNVARVSQIFQPINLNPKDAVIEENEINCKSQKLLVEMGIIKPESPGMFTFLPLGLRSLEKLSRLIDEELETIGCHKLLLPTLTSGKLWQKTGRWDAMGSELFQVKDRHARDYALSPTHEEAITHLVATLPSLTYKQLPLKLYQISSKFRDEIKPRFGLLRGREFIMKDLYTFDDSLKNAEKTYREVCGAYDRIFTRLGVNFIKVEGDTGNIGGKFSHEYHFLASIGEDRLKLCSSCGYATNVEVVDEEKCPKCQSPLSEMKGIEVGHTFLLGTKYSEALSARFAKDGKFNSICQMGCYGIGVSRIIAASVEALSSSTEITWPKAIAPFSICVITPKAGSKEESSMSLAHHLAENFDKLPNFHRDVIIDDRPSLTVGRKLTEAKKTGYPYIIVIGKSSSKPIPLVEIHNQNTKQVCEVTISDALNFFRKDRK